VPGLEEFPETGGHRFEIFRDFSYTGPNANGGTHITGADRGRLFRNIEMGDASNARLLEAISSVDGAAPTALAWTTRPLPISPRLAAACSATQLSPTSAGGRVLPPPLPRSTGSTATRATSDLTPSWK
jgi:hypothetical protein